MIFSLSEPLIMTATEEDSTSKSLSRVTVHDPSIVKCEDTYYVFGSHMANAKSTDLVNWTQMNTDWNARETEDAWKADSIYGDVLTNYAESFEWAGYDDGTYASNGGLALWAPDVKYNPDYTWKDGNTGAYMLYYSASSTWKRSCIGYAVAKEIDGPYQYVDTIIYSGFGNNWGMSDNSVRDIYWGNDYLHFNELIDSKVIEGVSSNWFDSSGVWNASYAPNAIDPTIFFDAEDNMYMVYGSWSGGIWIQELDEKTGAIEYPGEDGVEEVSGNVVDRYFGTRIAGGKMVSGEGPYIVYDEEAGYYYLYETYGGLNASGGYNMRLYRSKNVYGPYVDAKGQNAKDNTSKNDGYGIKLIGNYQFNYQPGYRSAGHNSALIDEDGSRYLIYHQRFNKPKNQTEHHEVRVRQQFVCVNSF